MVVHGVDIDALSEEQKQDVLRALVASIDSSAHFELSPEQEAELTRRSELIRAGKMELLDIDEAIDSL